jgi:hypothetical protein
MSFGGLKLPGTMQEEFQTPYQRRCPTGDFG